MERRRDGVNGWTKDECPFSRTGWAWCKAGTGRAGGIGCTCEPCKPPRKSIAVWLEPDDPDDYEPQEEPHG